MIDIFIFVDSLDNQISLNKNITVLLLYSQDIYTVIINNYVTLWKQSTEQMGFLSVSSS